ncbi:serine/threonine protein kinase [Myxococcota bacterium]|nr:serine/threonine protein kinase [Myxococcota bacterium]
MSGLNFGPYRVRARRGGGGMGAIDEAIYLDGLRPITVALKRLLPRYNDDEQFIGMLTDEARILAELDHPNIVRFLEFGEVEGQRFLAMEWVDGVDLWALIRRLKAARARIAPRLAGWIVAEALRGLHYAHERRGADGAPLGIIHRDFSASNVLVGFNGAVKLIDFGIAKARLNQTQTQLGIIKGKRGYMSPEQILSMPLDRRADIFAAGVLLYHLIQGTRPFEGADDAEIQRRILKEAPPPLDGDEADELAPLLARALAKVPAARFPTAAAFAAALDALRPPDFDGPAALAALLDARFDDAWRAARRAEEIAAPREDTSTARRAAYTRIVTGAVAALDAWLADQRR